MRLLCGLSCCPIDVDEEDEDCGTVLTVAMKEKVLLNGFDAAGGIKRGKGGVVCGLISLLVR